jgi:flagellin
MISSSYFEGTPTGDRGLGPADPVMVITAKDKGTQNAGINIHFVNDIHSGLKEWNDAYDAVYENGQPLPDIMVAFNTNPDGSRELIITANLGTDAKSEINAGLLARALNAAMVNVDGKMVAFSSLFEANALQFAPGENNGDGVAGSVLFNTDISKPSATMVGGYRVESAITGDGKASTSTGIGMTGQTDANERLIIESEELGSDQFIAINVITGQLNMVDEWGSASNYANGYDMVATVNGMKATAQGNNISINTPELAMSMNVANAPGWTGFTITGGGALFQLGPDVVSQQQIRVGIGSMLSSNLGGNSGQLYMLKSGNVAALTSDDNGRKMADRIVNEAIQYVASTRGRLGALQKGTLEPNISALQDSMTALTEANAMITNADFAVESSNLMRLQLLIQAGAQTLGIANQLPQYAASLVR